MFFTDFIRVPPPDPIYFPATSEYPLPHRRINFAYKTVQMYDFDILFKYEHLPKELFEST